MQTPDSNQTADWHRFYAIECNNRAWELAVRDRTALEDTELLNTAHSSAWHWAHAGDELNRMRATMLLAEVHALLNLGETAMGYAEQMRDYFVGKADTADWELAFTHAVHSHAAGAAGQAEAHEASYAEAQAAMTAIASEEDRSVVLATFERVPVPPTSSEAP